MIWCCTKQSLSGKPARRACAQIARHSPNRSGLRHSHPALRPVDAVARRRLRPARFRRFPSGRLRSGKKNRPRSQLKIFCTKIEPPKSMAARKTNPISARSHRRFFVLFPQGASGESTRERERKNFWCRCVQGKHPYPSRTRRLRPERPMVLHWRRCGRAGGRQIKKGM